MDAYSDFADVYDTFMDETPYEVWGDFVVELMNKYGVTKPTKNAGKDTGSGAGDEAYNTEENTEEALEEEKNLIAELGCGTGSFTINMAKRGYDIIGIDMSSDMLDIARKKTQAEGLDIMYLEQDMRELDLYCTAGTILSVCDSINYLLADDDVIETFKLVNNFLFPKGVFIFDFNTLHKYRDVIGDVTIAENREDCSFIWDNYYHDKAHINEYDLTIFAKCGEGDVFKRSVETHYQRGYTLDEMISFVERAGLMFITAIDADTHEAPTDESERIYIVAGECGKQL
ncbi:class I SAM-dependent methyltransferase [Butyrivibrio sp. XB500-5]|uniref:class I SAM-dependent DNA methyltransferase n=1 Tax=Butyrivibrio sp. XB500-5 TaxID=2364880 RepID=UPI000EAA5DBF|nr:class I SAM-dependent methyltransferase [Butyrivibrio sp. XB500-5]RKM60038.1 class I SAM-dependent methyltransferase [Butyrivibrio sp. XB500-5]